MALSKLKSMGLPKTSIKLAKKMKENKLPSFTAPKIKIPSSPKIKGFDLGKITKGIKLPKAKKLAVLKAKVKKHVRI